MTRNADNRTTELRISEPLRGFIRHQSNRAYIDGGQSRWLTEIADKIDAKHEQAIAATVGNGMCELEPLSALDVTLNMLNETSWGVCSECGTASPMDATFCCECGRKVKR